MFYVYTLAYPDGTVFYVGKGSFSKEARIDRIDCHEREARRGYPYKRCQIIREIWASGGQVIKTKVYETSVEQDAFIYEWCLINLIYGREKLANMTGEGYIISQNGYTAPQYRVRTVQTWFASKEAI